MADAKKTVAPETGEAPKKGKSKLLIIVLAAVLVVVLGGGAAFLLLKPAPSDEDAEAGEPKSARAQQRADISGPPVFAKLDPFVVKLQSDGHDAYVQAVPELRLTEAKVADQIKAYMPKIRHQVLLILASKNAAELSNPAGMQALANQIREAINATLEDRRPDPAKEQPDNYKDGPVIAVFFSSLIVQ